MLASIAGVFGDNLVSIQSALQKETVDNVATLVIITHKVKESNMSKALKMLSQLPSVAQVSNSIRVGME